MRQSVIIEDEKPRGCWGIFRDEEFDDLKHPDATLWKKVNVGGKKGKGKVSRPYAKPGMVFADQVDPDRDMVFDRWAPLLDLVCASLAIISGVERAEWFCRRT